MKKQHKEPWQIAAARFCVEQSEIGFTLQEIEDHVKNSYKVNNKHIEHFFIEEIQKPSGREFNRIDVSGNWAPPLDLVAKVTDYDELKEARKNAKNAFWLSMIAILISAVTLIITTFK